MLLRSGMWPALPLLDVSCALSLATQPLKVKNKVSNRLRDIVAMEFLRCSAMECGTRRRSLVIAAYYAVRPECVSEKREQLASNLRCRVVVRRRAETACQSRPVETERKIGHAIAAEPYIVGVTLAWSSRDCQVQARQFRYPCRPRAPSFSPTFEC